MCVYVSIKCLRESRKHTQTWKISTHTQRAYRDSLPDNTTTTTVLPPAPLPFCFVVVLPVCISACLFVCLSVYLLHVSLCAYVSVCVYENLCLVCVCLCMCVLVPHRMLTHTQKKVGEFRSPKSQLPILSLSWRGLTLSSCISRNSLSLRRLSLSLSPSVSQYNLPGEMPPPNKTSCIFSSRTKHLSTLVSLVLLSG